MKASCKLLPHLNQLYSQKKSYDYHKRKINQIKYSQHKKSFKA